MCGRLPFQRFEELVAVCRRLFSVMQRPATFAEAGVVAPFTTPLIAQARLRLDHRSRAEVVARNPTGSEGVYVVPLGAIGEYFRLSIHDRSFVEHLERLQPISPLTIRGVTLALAVEGLAGPDAKESAEQAIAATEEQALLTMLLLLERLLHEAGLPRIEWKAIDTGDKNVRERLRPHFKQLEPSIGIDAAELVSVVDELSAVVAPIGLPSATFKSYAATTLEEVQAMRASVERWATAERDEWGAVARLVIECADLTIAASVHSLEAAAGTLETAGKLLKAHATAPERVAEVLTRPIWLLDGWRHLTALWSSVAESSRDDQRDAMAEIGELVPLVPLVVDEWLGKSREQVQHSVEIRRWVRMNEDWRTGLLIERQAVVEQLQAKSL